MRRRTFLAALLAVFFSAAPATAQTAGRVYRLGHLSITAESVEATRAGTLSELARRGFVEGQNLVFESRLGSSAQLPALAGELVAAKIDALIAIGPEAIRAAREATRSVPIVAFGASPIELGFAKALARPGSNVTGVIILTAELDAKRLQLLRDAVPQARRVAALLRGSGVPLEESERELRSAAASSAVALGIYNISGATDYEPAFARMQQAGAEGLVIGAHPELFRDGAALAERALAAKLPTVCEWAEMARTGCLLGYGPDRAALRRRLADFVARIFRGASPADLPIEQPTEFRFAINLKIAAALGIGIPPSMLARADEVIE